MKYDLFVYKVGLNSLSWEISPGLLRSKYEYNKPKYDFFSRKRFLFIGTFL